MTKNGQFFLFHKMRNVLKPIKKQFSDFYLLINGQFYTHDLRKFTKINYPFFPKRCAILNGTCKKTIF